MQKLLSMLFWIVIEILLVVAESFFCIQMQEISKLYKKAKKEYSLSSNNGKNGHRGRELKEIEKDIENCKIEYISWCCIAIAGAYAIFDCFLTHIIK